MKGCAHNHYNSVQSQCALMWSTNRYWGQIKSTSKTEAKPSPNRTADFNSSAQYINTCAMITTFCFFLFSLQHKWSTCKMPPLELQKWPGIFYTWIRCIECALHLGVVCSAVVYTWEQLLRPLSVFQHAETLATLFEKQDTHAHMSIILTQELSHTPIISVMFNGLLVRHSGIRAIAHFYT